MYQKRLYRDYYKQAPYRLNVVYGHSDLYISADSELDAAKTREYLKQYYTQIEEYILLHPEFRTSLSPLPHDPSAPPIVREMLGAAQVAGVGPFASVAGAIACYVGRELLQESREVIVENGGDLFAKILSDKRVGIYLGDHYDLDTLVLTVPARTHAFGIASSSASIGHSINFGSADLVTVVAQDALHADSFATALSNRIKQESDVEGVLSFARENEWITGMLVFLKGKLFFWGDVELA